MFQPLKSGHLTNQDTFFGPKYVLIRDVLLYVTEPRAKKPRLSHADFLESDSDSEPPPSKPLSNSPQPDRAEETTTAVLKNPRKLALDSSDSESEGGSSDSDESSSGGERSGGEGSGGEGSGGERSVHSDGVEEPASKENLTDQDVTATVLCSPAMDTADVMESDSLGLECQERSDNNLQSPVMDTVDLLGTTDGESRLDKVETDPNEDIDTFDMQMEMTSATIDHQ